VVKNRGPLSHTAGKNIALSILNPTRMIVKLVHVDGRGRKGNLKGNETDPVMKGKMSTKGTGQNY